MIGTSLAQRTLRLPYSALRAPLRALDAQLVRRLPDRSPVRLTIERGLASCDAAAGRWLNDARLSERARLMFLRAQKIERATELGEHAEQLRTEVAQREADERKARQAAESARAQKGRRIAKATQQKEADKREAEQRAESDAAAKKRQAEEQAAARKSAAADERKAEQQRAAERAERAKAPARADLKKASAEKGSADERRGDAGALSRLAETEKQSRRAAAKTSTA